LFLFQQAKVVDVFYQDFDFFVLIIGSKFQEFVNGLVFLVDYQGTIPK
jgi:hypothetical protein